jgi:hypothetical protein
MLSAVFTTRPLFVAADDEYSATNHAVNELRSATDILLDVGDVPVVMAQCNSSGGRAAPGAPHHRTGVQVGVKALAAFSRW